MTLHKHSKSLTDSILTRNRLDPRLSCCSNIYFQKKVVFTRFENRSTTFIYTCIGLPILTYLLLSIRNHRYYNIWTLPSSKTSYFWTSPTKEFSISTSRRKTYFIFSQIDRVPFTMLVRGQIKKMGTSEVGFILDSCASCNRSYAVHFPLFSRISLFRSLPKWSPVSIVWSHDSLYGKLNLLYPQLADIHAVSIQKPWGKT